MILKDLTKKDIFHAKLTGEPIKARLSDPFDFTALLKHGLLEPIGESDTGANFKATHPLIIQGLGVGGVPHLRPDDIFSLSIR